MNKGRNSQLESSYQSKDEAEAEAQFAKIAANPIAANSEVFTKVEAVIEFITPRDYGGW
jgi:hypothetical protein